MQLLFRSSRLDGEMLNWPAFASWLNETPLVVAACVAGMVAVIGHWVSRGNTTLTNNINREAARLGAEQARQNARLAAQLQANLKLAEMRQVWINNLRDDMAAFQARGVTPGNSQEQDLEFYRLGTRIELFMNRADPDYEALSQALYAFLGAKTLEEKYAANPRYVAICQRILKREWDVLKAEIKEVAAD